ncbi:MAG: hypothetical protein LUQ04_04000 [Methanoregula sp.]|nr:hypothetical protein [Methanoregula sp.]
MTSLLESWSEYSIVLIVIGIIFIVVIVVAAHTIKKNREKKQNLQKKSKTSNFSYQPRKYHSEKKLIQRMLPALQSRTVPITPTPVSEENSILQKKTDITQNLLQLTRKYSLDICTIATSDGLVVATSGGEQALTDAAAYGKMRTPIQTPIISGVMIIELNLKGSALVGIIRTKNPVSEDISKKIAADTQAILNFWI